MQTRHPMIIQVGINSFSSLVITAIPPFLGTTCTRLTHSLSDIGKIMPTSRSLMTWALTTSFIFRLSLLYGKAEGLWSSSIRLCECKRKDLSHWCQLSSKQFLPCAILWHSLSFWFEIRFKALITGSYVLSPRKVYSRCSGNFFSYNLGASSV